MREVVRGFQPNERFLQLQDEAIKDLRMYIFLSSFFFFFFKESSFSIEIKSVVSWGGVVVQIMSD